MAIAAPSSSGTSVSPLPTTDEALASVATHIAAVRGIGPVALRQARGRVLASDLHARVASPAFDRSAMDGYALRFADLRTHPALRCVGRARAGEPYPSALAAGECVRIATGAALPAGADTIAVSERCALSGDRVTVSGSLDRSDHIRRRGEDFAQGDFLLAAGTRLQPEHLPLLASAGHFAIEVRRPVRAAILSIGDELCAGPVCADGQSFDANRVMLLAGLDLLGIEVSDLGIVPDRREEITARLRNAAGAHDVVISSAGTSKGDEDFVRAAVADCGGDLLIAGVAIKPGKPIAFATIGSCLHIALPGNPAAAHITFLTLGIPLLRQLAGETAENPIPQTVRAGFAYRKKKGWREYLRVVLRPGSDGIADVELCAKDGSAMLASLAQCRGLICLDEDVDAVTPGALLPYIAFESMLR